MAASVYSILTQHNFAIERQSSAYRNRIHFILLSYRPNRRRPDNIIGERSNVNGELLTVTVNYVGP